MSVALIALDAIVNTEGPRERRRIPIADFHRLPGSTPQIETALEHGELITSVDVPKPGAAWRSRYLKVRDRASYEFALVSVAALLDVSGGCIRAARIAFGGVGTKPWRAPHVEQILAEATVSEQLFKAAGEKAVEGPRPVTIIASKSNYSNAR